MKKKYIVKFYKKDYIYIYLKSKEEKLKFLTFVQLINYLEFNNIDFDSIGFNMSMNDLFYHFVDYDSLYDLKYKKHKENKNRL